MYAIQGNLVDIAGFFAHDHTPVLP